MSRWYKYDVTVSFAEEDRPFVDRVVAQLKEKKIRVFYDDHERINTWGKDLGLYLDKVYRKEAKFCVIFISEHYKRKRWTRHERDRAQARAYFAEHEEYILPFRLDAAELDGVSDTIAYLSKDNFNEGQLADAIFDKIKSDRAGWWSMPRFSISSLKKIRLAMMAAALAGVLYLGVAHKFTPVGRITRQIYEDSKLPFNGAICRDGWMSHSHGPGTCSYHGGVDHYIDTVAYLKTISQSHEEAKELNNLLGD